jgi:hypothetical protein
MVLPFVAMTFLSWGLYGPVLHEGQYEMGAGGRPSSLRPFICVGVAYFLIAVVVPLAALWAKGESGKWTIRGAFWSFAAGAAGAVGALGIILAFKFRGSPVFVMPLVFGLAPVVNTFVTMWMTKTFKQASTLFFAGVILVAVGAAGVMFFKPKIEPAAPTVSETDDQQAAEAPSETQAEPPILTGLFMVPLSIALTAICWGSYGPVLHKGQMKMDGSRLRPFLCVGLAYFGIAVLAPLPLLEVFQEPGGWNVWGVVWSLAAGAAGAVGALGIILAFNYGGKPIYVMPLVFGGAPVVNTLTTTLLEGSIGQISPLFYLSIAMVIGGAVTVLVFAPRPKKTAAEKKPAKKKPAKEKPAAKKEAPPERAEAERQPLVASETPAAENSEPATGRDGDHAESPGSDSEQVGGESLEETTDSDETIDRPAP